jgi:hypothetical protein
MRGKDAVGHSPHTGGTASGAREYVPSALSPFPNGLPTGFDLGEGLDVRFLPGGRVRLLRPLWYYDDIGATALPAGEESDGTTSPALAWPVIGHPFSYSTLPPALVHDAWLRRLPRPTRQTVREYWRLRSRADRRYRRALRRWGRGAVRTALHYAGVRAYSVRVVITTLLWGRPR